MPAPAARYEILPARGTKANLDAAIADIAENELCYATDEEALYVKIGGVLVPASGSGTISYGASPPVDAEQGDLWYDTNDARIFVYTGTEWADASPDAGVPTVITSDSAPGSPQDGDLWFRTTDGRLYVYYDDGNSSQWVDANPSNGASNWTRTGTTLSPAIAGDDVDLGTGNLTVPSLNGGQLAGMRNVLINGRVSINQRGVTYAAAAVGDYWADRWKKTAGGMTQIVEDGNYQPSTQYTLSGTGVTTQQITSPASGNWTIPDVPSTATNIQLEPGPVATPFEHRLNELALCQRYYEKGTYETRIGLANGSIVASWTQWVSFATTKRTTPTMAGTNLQGTFLATNPDEYGCSLGRSNTVANRINSGTYSADAEL